jgi:hypothetical protein
VRDRGPLLDIVDALEMYAAGEPVRESVGQRLAEALAAKGGWFSSGGNVRIALKGCRLDEGLRAVTETSTAGSLLAAGQPEIRQFMRPFPLRELCEVLPTTTYNTPFARELSPLNSSPGASGVAETNTAVDVASLASFAADTVTPGLLTADVTVTQQLADDSPVFGQWLNMRLPMEVSNREEYALIQGNGETVNAGIVGFLNDSAVPTHGYGGFNEAITGAAGVVANAGAVPMAVAVHPSDLFTALLASPTFFTAIEAHLLLVPTLGVPAGHLVAGAWGPAAVIVDRQDAEVAVYTQHSDYRTKGLALVQCTAREGFEITQPWAFCIGTF